MTEHFYSYDPFIKRTYFYFRSSKSEDYQKKVYFPAHYETTKGNKWHEEYKYNCLRILPWFLKNFNFVKSHSSHDYKVLRAKCIDLASSGLLGVLCSKGINFVLKHNLNPYQLSFFNKNVKQNFRRTLNLVTPSVFFFIVLWELHLIRTNNHL